MILTVFERNQIKFLLPAQGDLKTLELVEKIINKTVEEKTDKEIDVRFEKSEISFLKYMIESLDVRKQLNVDSFSLIKKILRST
jgi:hypothetical protein